MNLNDIRKQPQPFIKRALTHFGRRNGKTIVEIGSMRNRLEHSLEITDLPCCMEGHSSAYLARAAENFYTVDIDPSCSTATRKSLEQLGLPRHNVVTGDGIVFLRSFIEPIDLLYLDAWGPDIPEFAERHLEAYRAARGNLHDTSIIAIDGTDLDYREGVYVFTETGYTGKGRLVITEAGKDGFQVIFSGRVTLLMKKKPMNVPFEGVARLVSFLEKIEKETYPEYPSTIHREITTQQINTLLEKYPLPAHAQILDVGCGQGPALELFRQHGYEPTGITINDEDLDACREAGFNVVKMDQSFLDFSEQTFHLIWARHVIEHSIFPYFTFSEFYRVLKPGGILYLEVPALETSGRHEENGNHYSVHSVKMWGSLLTRAGFQLQERLSMKFDSEIGPDEYWAFILRKAS